MTVKLAEQVADCSGFAAFLSFFAFLHFGIHSVVAGIQGVGGYARRCAIAHNACAGPGVKNVSVSLRAYRTGFGIYGNRLPLIDAGGVASHANVICGVFLHPAAKKTRPTDIRATTFQGRCESIFGSSVPCAEESPTGIA